MADKDFILAIKLYPELYQIYKDDGVDGEENNKELWSQFARENKFKNGAIAELKWRQIISKYVSFLMYGTPFPFGREMEFMQVPLLRAGLEDTQTDSDIDETELKKVLSVYEEFPTDIKTQHVRTSDIDREASNKCALSKGEANELNKAENIKFYSNTEEHETDILIPNNYNKNEDMKGQNAENKLISKQNEKHTVNTENISTDITATTHAQAVNNPSGDAGAPGGFTNLTSLELIFLGYAKVLQQMPLRLQLQTKRKIADIMDEAELKLFEGN